MMEAKLDKIVRSIAQKYNLDVPEKYDSAGYKEPCMIPTCILRQECAKFKYVTLISHLEFLELRIIALV